jgi:hypothetical protein
MPDDTSQPTEAAQSVHQPIVEEKGISESALQVAQTAGIVMGGTGGLVGGIATAVGVAKGSGKSDGSSAGGSAPQSPVSASDK